MSQLTDRTIASFRQRAEACATTRRLLPKEKSMSGLFGGLLASLLPLLLQLILGFLMGGIGTPT